MRRGLPLVLLLFALLPAAHAFIGVQNTITQTTSGGTQAYSVSVMNSGSEPLYDVRLQVLNTRSSGIFSYPGIQSGASVRADGTLPTPPKPGSYLIIANVTARNYLNKDFNVVSAAAYFVAESKAPPVSARIAAVSLLGSNSTTVAVSNTGPSPLNLTLSVLSSSELALPQPQAIQLAPHESRNISLAFAKGLANFNSAHQAYLVMESEDADFHYLSAVPFTIRVPFQPYEETGKGAFLVFGALFALAIAAIVLFRWYGPAQAAKDAGRPLGFRIAKFALIASALYLLYLLYMSGLFINFNDNTKFALTVLFGAYLAYAIPYSLKLPARVFGERDKIDELMDFAANSLGGGWRKNFTPEVRTAFLSIAVKAFFLPIMLDFALTNFWAIHGSLASFSPSYQPFDLLFVWGYGFSMAVLFFVDTWVFVLSYGIEAPLLGNRIKSVDPTFLGWFSAIICYPPFSQFAHAYVPSGPGDWADFNSFLVTGAVRAAAVLLFIIYVWATYALGMRSSNLTNRGIVGDGPYKYVRHPAYASKNLAWLLFALPSFNPLLFLSQGVWAAVYVVRAYTEERHLSSDPDYIEYRKKVRWMFIPGVW